MSKDDTSHHESPDGNGAFKVNYITPDKRNIGNDRFYTMQEARLYAQALERQGYETTISGSDAPYYDVDKETIGNETIRLSFSIRVF